MGKAKKLAKGSVLRGAIFVLRVLISLFMTPFMIACLGDHYYGLWMLVASFSGFYGMLDLGLSTAVQRYMSRSVGVGDTKEANGVFNTSLVVFCILGFFAMIFVGVMSWLAPNFVKNAVDVPVFRLIIILCSVNVVLGFPMRSFWGILSSNLRFDISVNLEIINVISKAALIFFFLKYGFGVIALATINLVLDMLWNVANMFYAFKVAPYIKISRKYVEFKRVKQFLSYSIYVFISRVADNIRYNIDNYVISAFIGLSSITVYSIGIRLVSYAVDLSARLVGHVTPVFSQYEGLGDFDSIREKFLFVFKIGNYVAIFFGGLLIILGGTFIERWVGFGYKESYVIILILVMPSVFGMMMIPSSQLLYGISKHKLLTLVNIIEALINLVLSLIFVKFWGIRGVALGTAIPAIVARLFFQPAYTARVLKISAWRIYSQILSAFIKGAVVISVIYVLAEGLIAVSFVHLITFAVIQALCYALIIFKIGLSAVEQGQLVKALFPSRVHRFLIKTT